MGENHLTTDEPTGAIDGIDADALLNSIESGGNREIPMQGEPEPAGEAPEAAAPSPEDYEFTWNGKQIKGNRDAVLKWASQGYDYSQKMAEINKQRHGWESEKQTFERQYSPYKTIDEYAKQNPDWWRQVESAYQARTQSGGVTDASASSDLSSIERLVEQKLQPILEFKTSIESEKAAQQRESEDRALSEEIQSIRQSYGNLDWDHPDETGLTLEQRVIQHAMDSGIQSFRAAFRDYNHEHLVKMAAEKAKEDTNKELQKRTKSGLLGQSPTPKKGLSAAEGVKNKSYEDLMREALDEAGIA